jgi:hypothetical protein
MVHLLHVLESLTRRLVGNADCDWSADCAVTAPAADIDVACTMWHSVLVSPTKIYSLHLFKYFSLI